MAMRVHWLIAPVFLLTVPLLGVVSSYLSKKIKKVSKTILGETTALAGSTTESLRNIELVKSSGLTNQEVSRLNTVTAKILRLELNKVKYIRSLSFIQGTTVNFLRTCLVFLFYFLIFKDQITLGQMMTLMFYSFFIFAPLQELGNVIAIQRETQASLANFEAIMKSPAEPRPVNPTKLGKINSLKFDNVIFKHNSAVTNAVERTSFQIKQGETIAFVGPSGSGKTEIRLYYLVQNAGWSPIYNFYSKLGGKTVRVEFNARVQQVTGENWDNVNLTLSNATPALSALAPGLSPFRMKL